MNWTNSLDPLVKLNCLREMMLDNVTPAPFPNPPNPPNTQITPQSLLEKGGDRAEFYPSVSDYRTCPSSLTQISFSATPMDSGQTSIHLPSPQFVLFQERIYHSPLNCTPMFSYRRRCPRAGTGGGMSHTGPNRVDHSRC